jgi:hypothetical protein
MELAITDITMEYEWNDIVPPSFEKVVEDGFDREKVALPKEGKRRFRFSASRGQVADPKLVSFDRLLLEESATVLVADGNCFESDIKASLSGSTAKYLQSGGWPVSSLQGGISNTKRYFLLPMNLTPFGYSVLRCRFSEDCDQKPLSVLLSQRGRIDNTIRNIDGFNTISADILYETTDKTWMRVYFSVDHNYTPVRYEYIKGLTGDEVSLVVEVHSLKKVGQYLWFPSEGVIYDTYDPNEADLYKATSNIIVNQGLEDSVFDIEFPLGTTVYDEIRGIKYTVPADK